MIKKETYLTKSPSETKKKAEVLAKGILRAMPALSTGQAGGRQDKKERKNALVFGLEGDLGGGKTTFLQGFAKGLGIKRRVTSPTFIIFRRYQLDKDLNFYHFDCYRIGNTKEILSLGFKEIISNPNNIVVIEWAGNIKKIMPKDTVWTFFTFIDKNKREIKTAP